jgi:hypothetical protein
VNELIEFLKERQRDEGLTDGRMAAKFGISREHYLTIKRSPEMIGDKLIGRALVAYQGTKYYPRLTKLVISFLETKFGQVAPPG